MCEILWLFKGGKTQD